MTPGDYVMAARCPESVPVGEFGLWTIERMALSYPVSALVGFDTQTILFRATCATLHTKGEIVMEDSLHELRRHIPIWLRASGRVLVTGLGLGCVLRGLLCNPEVDHVTIVETDSDIIRAIWPEFIKNERALLLQGDAFSIDWPPGTRFDWAWHDIWDEHTHVAALHSKLMVRYKPMVKKQGAWGMPRWWRRRVGGDFVYG